MNAHLTLILFASIFALAVAAPLDTENFEMRAPLAQVIRTCQKPLHAALTFVSHSSKGSPTVLILFMVRRMMVLLLMRSYSLISSSLRKIELTELVMTVTK